MHFYFSHFITLLTIRHVSYMFIFSIFLWLGTGVFQDFMTKSGEPAVVLLIKMYCERFFCLNCFFLYTSIVKIKISQKSIKSFS